MSVSGIHIFSSCLRRRIRIRQILFLGKNAILSPFAMRSHVSLQNSSCFWWLRIFYIYIDTIFCIVVSPVANNSVSHSWSSPFIVMGSPLSVSNHAMSLFIGVTVSPKVRRRESASVWVLSVPFFNTIWKFSSPRRIRQHMNRQFGSLISMSHRSDARLEWTTFPCKQVRRVCSANTTSNISFSSTSTSSRYVKRYVPVLNGFYYSLRFGLE